MSHITRVLFLSIVALLSLCAWSPAKAQNECNVQYSDCPTHAAAAALAETMRQAYYPECPGAWAIGNRCGYQVLCDLPIGDRRELRLVDVYIYSHYAVAVECPWYGTPGVGGPITLGQAYYPVDDRLANQAAGDKSKCPVCGDKVGNPVSAASGNKYQLEIDYVDPTSDGRLSFSRSYNSSLAFLGDETGPHWIHSFTRKVVNFSLADAPTSVYLQRADGQTIDYIKSGGAWGAGGTHVDKLVEIRDSSDHLAGWVVTIAKDRSVETYSAAGQLLSVDYPDGYSQVLTYTGGLLTSVADSYGRRLVLGYLGGRLSTLTDPAGQVVSYTRNANGMLSLVQYPGSTSRGYIYQNDQLTSLVDERGITYASWGYDAAMRASSTTHASGAESFSIVYNANGSSTISTPLGATQTRQFEVVQGEAKVSSLTDSCAGCVSRTKTYTYDAMGFPDLESDFSGVVTDYDYSVDGLISQVIYRKGPDQTVESYVWNSALRLPTQITRNGSRKDYSYNARGQILTESTTDTTTSVVRTTSYTYCEAAGVSAGTCPRIGLTLSVDGPRTDVSDVNSYVYYQTDAVGCSSAPSTCQYRKGDLWKVVNALSQVREIVAYDGAGRVLRQKDLNGVVTDFEYNARGLGTKISVRGVNDSVVTDDAVTQIEYSPAGDMTKVTQPDGAFILFSFDDARRVVKITDASGDHLDFVLDAEGNRKQETASTSANVLKKKLVRTLNSLGQLVESRDADVAAGQGTLFTYTAAGFPDLTSDPLSRTSDADFDAFGQVKKVLADVGGVAATTQIQRDLRDNVKTVVDARSLSTTYVFNGFNEVTSSTSPDSGVVSFTYNQAGLVATRTDARGAVATSYYDGIGRLYSTSYSMTGEALYSEQFTYDWADNKCGADEQFKIGRLGKVVDLGGSTSFCYDRFGNLARKIQIINGSVYTTWYTYSLAGRVTKVRYQSGNEVTFGRDAVGRVVSVYVTPYGTSTPLEAVKSISYLPFGPWTRLEFGTAKIGGGSALWTGETDLVIDPGDGGGGGGGFDPTTPPYVLQRLYDQNYRIDGTELYDYQTDLVGNVVSAIGGTPGVGNRYVYDGLNRLIQIKSADGSTLLTSYSYDAAGNRTSQASGGVTTTYSYPATSHKVSTLGSAARIYDAAGNLTNNGVSPGGRRFDYNSAGRMKAVRNPVNQVLMNYFYNAKGERVRKNLGTEETHFVYDEEGHLLSEAGTSIAQTDYVWVDDTPVLVLRGGQIYDILTDPIDTPLRVVKPEKTLTSLWTWNILANPFGDAAANDDPNATGVHFPLSLRFAGQYADAESGLFYNYQRDYEPRTGRFVEPDPLGKWGGSNSFAYVASSPVYGNDPTGLSPGAGAVVWGGRAVVAGSAGATLEASIASNPVGWTVGVAIAGYMTGELINDHYGEGLNRAIWNAMHPVPQRPKRMTPGQEKIWDTVCKNDPDPCRYLKVATLAAIAQAEKKMQKMLDDPEDLYIHARFQKNFAVTGTNTTWVGHIPDLTGRIGRVADMISLGILLGCDMSEEIKLASTLFVPTMPIK
jgi:RHS repeat-associated protein